MTSPGRVLKWSCLSASALRAHSIAAGGGVPGIPFDWKPWGGGLSREPGIRLLPQEFRVREGPDLEISDLEISDLEISDLEISDLEMSDLEISDLEISDAGIWRSQI